MKPEARRWSWSRRDSEPWVVPGKGVISYTLSAATPVASIDVHLARLAEAWRRTLVWNTDIDALLDARLFLTGRGVLA